ncbi:DNA polymerase III subunit chi [Candidatus Methylobacter favarea]|uniref:DNA polymerase III subunit chi n=1 Tax=Candidatus Methylobacter favarea TaxID=2707345 RepID=A0A8S0WIY2_9GAMM|nr:DNA polymerase III subunit chi [Candidatus Methylobacter favarea]CAA9890884.1 DNA polymerase III subunit chi [Candidatus Methylobacter favarea]
MPEVTFYILQSQSRNDRYLFACKLIEKAYRSGHFCYVLTDSDEQSQIIDDLLWTFRAGSFIPHQRYSGEPPAVENVVLIGCLAAPPNWQKTLINLSSEYPQNFKLAERILEILADCDDTKEAGRNRYRRYQQAGANLTTHQIKK